MTAEDNVEETVMLTRRDRRRAGARAVPEPNEAPPLDRDEEPGADPSSDQEATVVVDRSPTGTSEPADEATVVVDRSPTVVPEPADDATVVVERGSTTGPDAADDATVVVARPARRARRDDDAVRDDAAAEEPVPSDAEVTAFAAPAERAPAIYKPRPAPREPSAPPVVVGGESPTRADDPSRPSVAKQARRWGMLTLVAFGVACVASVAGLVGVGLLALG